MELFEQFVVPRKTYLIPNLPEARWTPMPGCGSRQDRRGEDPKSARLRRYPNGCRACCNTEAMKSFSGRKSVLSLTIWTAFF